MENETKRKGIHILNGLWAFILPFFPRFFAILIVIIALIFVFILARPKSPFGSIFQKAFESMARNEDWQKGYLIGPTIYVVMVLVLIIFIDYRIAGAIFAVLAFGDGFATIFGRKFGKHKLYMNKSLEGSVAFFVFSVISSYTIFLLINTFNSPGAGLMIIPSLMLPSNLNLNLFVLFIAFMVICLFLTLVELFVNNLLNDNLIIPILGCILFYFFLDMLIVIQMHV